MGFRIFYFNNCGKGKALSPHTYGGAVGEDV
jgi:hypothetical protein